MKEPHTADDSKRDAVASGDRVAVIGAGLSGLTCANVLQRQGFHVHTFEKSRGLGGRMATRRREGFTADHGAVFADVRWDLPEVEGGAGEAWAAMLVDLETLGAAARWEASGSASESASGQASGSAPAEASQKVVGMPGMSSFVRPFVHGFEVNTAVEIAAIASAPTGFTLRDNADQSYGPFAHVVVAIPAAQAGALWATCGVDGDKAAALSAIAMTPCMVAMIAFDGRLEGVEDVRANPAPNLALMVRNSAKPGRAGSGHEPPGDVWVLHADLAWSRAHLDHSKDEIAAELLGALRGAFPAVEGLSVTHLEGHRWRYSAATPVSEAQRKVAPQGYAAVPSVPGLYACGDWCVGPGLQAAFASGYACACAIADQAGLQPSLRLQLASPSA
ncbi:MAG: FAD-dependent oxidoreductase [Pseudomonadota bacterium]